jgi:hypothetical protein
MKVEAAGSPQNYSAFSIRSGRDARLRGIESGCTTTLLSVSSRREEGSFSYLKSYYLNLSDEKEAQQAVGNQQYAKLIFQGRLLESGNE